jgi:hypothetical protein
MSTIRLNRQNLHALSGSPGKNGFTKKQVELLGFNQYPPPKGWLTSLIGKEIPLDLYHQVAAQIRQKWQDGHVLKPIQYTGEFGFPRRDFTDHYHEACHLSISSAIIPEHAGHGPGSSALWLGRNEAPMHLNRAQVTALVRAMDRWLATEQL